MNCTLYYNKSDAICLTKDLVAIRPQDAQQDTFNIEITSDSSVIDPVFILSAPTNVLEANYMYVPTLGRYYFINDTVMSHGKLIISAHVDVLMSYAESIKKLYCMLDRQTNEDMYNLYLTDNMPPLNNPDNIRTIYFDDKLSQTNNYLLIVAGSNQ